MPLGSARAQALLAYLVLNSGRPQRREHLASLLWPDSTGAQARTNLRHVLHVVRGSVPGVEQQLQAGLQASTDTLCWNGSWADVTAFEMTLLRAEGAADGDGEGSAALLTEAVDLYTGDLLDGWSDEWVEPFREDYRRRVVAGLDRLVDLLARDGELDAAIAYGRRGIELDPLAENGYRSLIRLHDARGDRAAAVRVFHECAARLRDDLGIEPDAQTVAAYEALLTSDVGAAREPQDKLRVPPFVGRRTERRTLATLWRDCRAGRAHLVLLTGEPGVGKSRLADELRQWTVQHGAAGAAARSYLAEGGLPYAPVVAWLRELGVGRRGNRPDTGARAVLARLLPELTEGAEPGPPPEQGPDAMGSRLRLFEAAADALLAGGRPLVLVADDLDCADVETMQFVHYLVRAHADAPLLVLATARPGEADAGGPFGAVLGGLRALGRCTDLELARLDAESTLALAARLGHRLSEQDGARLYTETEGNPLFIVETFRAGWPDSGGDPRVLTPRVQAVLQTRLEALSPGARELAAVTATAGSSLAIETLAAIHPGGEDLLAADLDELWRRQVLRVAGGGRYDFTHDRLREVAYQGLSPVRRRRHHAVLARALQEGHGGEAGSVAAQIAHHLQMIGATAEAVDWYVRAAGSAQRVFADADAARLLLEAWELLRAPSDGGGSLARRAETELAVLTAIPGPLAAAQGYASPRLEFVLTRGLEVAQQLGVDPPASLVRARAMAALSHSDFETARRLGEQLVDGPDDAGLLTVEGHFVQGVSAAWLDDVTTARRHLEAALADYRPQNTRSHLELFGQDPRTLCLGRLAHLHLRSGEPGRAGMLQRESLDAAAALGHPFTLAGALLFAALLDLELADLPGLRERLEALHTVEPRIEGSPVRLFAAAMTGLLGVVDGQVSTGLARIDEALADPARRTAPGMPAMLARIQLDACLRAGEPARAQAAAELLLADRVRVWDHLARAVLARER